MSEIRLHASSTVCGKNKFKACTHIRGEIFFGASRHQHFSALSMSNLNGLPCSKLRKLLFKNLNSLQLQFLGYKSCTKTQMSVTESRRQILRRPHTSSSDRRRQPYRVSCAATECRLTLKQLAVGNKLNDILIDRTSTWSLLILYMPFNALPTANCLRVRRLSVAARLTGQGWHDRSHYRALTTHSLPVLPPVTMKM